MICPRSSALKGMKSRFTLRILTPKASVTKFHVDKGKLKAFIFYLPNMNSSSTGWKRFN